MEALDTVATDSNGDTPVHLAIREHSQSFVKIDRSLGHYHDFSLLNKSSLSFTKNRGRTPVHEAANYPDILSYLAEQFDPKYTSKVVTKQDSDGNTALHLAVLNSQEDNI